MFSSLRRVFSRPPEQPGEAPRSHVVLSERFAAIYAIGDVHGCLDQFEALQRAILADAERWPGPKLMVFIGDLVDRGPYSAQVIDRVLRRGPADFRRLALAGNHEETMARFLADPVGVASWLDWGGRETLLSYGLQVAGVPSGRHDLRRFRMQLEASIPEEHRAFIANAPASIRVGDYFFAHAGVRPGVELDQQKTRDLLWIREDFLDSQADFGALVVHGHTPVVEPDVRANRINIDTGVYATGRLTAVRLGAGEPHFLSS